MSTPDDLIELGAKRPRRSAARANAMLGETIQTDEEDKRAQGSKKSHNGAKRSNAPQGRRFRTPKAQDDSQDGVDETDDEGGNISPSSTHELIPPNTIIGAPSSVIMAHAAAPVTQGLGVGGSRLQRPTSKDYAQETKSHLTTEDESDTGSNVKRVRRGQERALPTASQRRLPSRSARSSRSSHRDDSDADDDDDDGHDLEGDSSHDEHTDSEQEVDEETERTFKSGVLRTQGSAPNSHGWRAYPSHPTDSKWGPLGQGGIPESIRQLFASTELNARAKGREHKGLRHFSLRVCDKLSVLSRTTYNNIANMLVAESRPLENEAGSGFDEKNIRRRIYDALNVLTAMDVLTKERKMIEWRGLPTEYQVDSVANRLIVARDRLEKKARLLEDLTLQFSGILAIMQRNAQRESLSNAQSPEARIANSQPVLRPPFILIDSDPSTALNISLTSDRTKTFIDYSNYFSLNDHNIVFKLLAKSAPEIVQPELRPLCPITFPPTHPQTSTVQLSAKSLKTIGETIPNAASSIIPKVPLAIEVMSLQQPLLPRAEGNTPVIYPAGANSGIYDK